MSSIPAAPVETSSSRVPSANGLKKDETDLEKVSRPSSALKTLPVATADGEEPNLSTISTSEPIQTAADTTNEPESTLEDAVRRLSSPIKVDLALSIAQTTAADEPRTSRPSSAAQENNAPASDVLSKDASPGSRPPSAYQKQVESLSNGLTTTVLTGSRPSSAAQKTNITTVTNSRPASASVTNEQLNTHEYTISSASHETVEPTNSDATMIATNSRPSSASQTTDITALSDTLNSTTTYHSRPPSANPAAQPTTINEPASAIPPNSRPSSARLASNGSNIDQPENASVGSRPSSAKPTNSRPSSANQKEAVTTVSDTLNTVARNTSRPSSANLKSDAIAAPRTSSRPSSASHFPNRTDSNNATTAPSSGPPPFHSNDPHIAEPIIGRPPSAIQSSTAEPSSVTTFPLSSDEHQSSEASSSAPRIGSAKAN